MDTFSSMLILFFLVMNPLGNLPVFIAELDRQPPERYRFIVLRECLVALAILLLFVFCGGEILKALRITQASLELAGGIILFMIAIKLVFGSASGGGEKKSAPESEPFIVPLAIPLFAGPAAMSTAILHGDPAERPLCRKVPRRQGAFRAGVADGAAADHDGRRDDHRRDQIRFSVQVAQGWAGGVRSRMIHSPGRGEAPKLLRR